MKILEYVGLDTSRVAPAYARITQAIARGDFRAAQVTKLTNVSHGTFYRARLNDADRLLFSMVRHGDETCALMLEVIANHDYDGSRFLRGAAIDEAKIPDCDVAEANREARPVRYLHPQRVDIHLLDKPISFDDAQQSVYRLPPPLIVVGSAGSGKTARTLEKLKHAEGEVLYVTQSAYLARCARDLYYANGFEHPGQDATFLSYREFVESICVPAGREASWRDFSGWFARMRPAFRDIDGHQAFEEIRGVLAAAAGGLLSRETSRQLGVRQSIFPQERRDALYDLFEKYRAWLADAGLFDLDLVAQQWQELAAPRYDSLVVDEMQDITNAQPALLLKTLKKPTHFLLCGDSNQVVHPNFFSWARVKNLFWHDPVVAERQDLRVLSANFRNAKEAIRVANRLLKIKRGRFGSIDRKRSERAGARERRALSLRFRSPRRILRKRRRHRAEGSSRRHARIAGQAGAGRRDSPDDPEADTGTVAGVDPKHVSPRSSCTATGLRVAPTSGGERQNTSLRSRRWPTQVWQLSNSAYCIFEALPRTAVGKIAKVGLRASGDPPTTP